MLEAARATSSALLDKRRSQIVELEDLCARVQAAEISHARAVDRLTEGRARLEEAEEVLSKAEAGREETERQFIEDVTSWFESLTAIRPPDHAMEGILSQPLEAMAPFAQTISEATKKRLDEDTARATASVREARARIGELSRNRESLAQADHKPPQRQDWRPPLPREGSGAPFYLLGDFSRGDLEMQGAIEAALEASGVLNAWVTTEGEVTDELTGEVYFVKEPQQGSTLRDFITPVETEGLSEETIGEVLASISLAPDDTSRKERNLSSLPSVCAVSALGEWRLGPLRGHAHKRHPTYIGKAARTKEKQRLLRGLDQEIEALTARERDARKQLENLKKLSHSVHKELSRFPRLHGVERAKAETTAALRITRRETANCELLSKAEQEAMKAVRHSIEERKSMAAGAGLVEWVEHPGALKEVTHHYRFSLQDLLEKAEILRQKRGVIEERMAHHEEALRRVEEARDSVDTSKNEAARAQARVSALKGSIGTDAKKLLERIHREEETHENVKASLSKCRKKKSTADFQIGQIKGNIDTAQTALEKAQSRHRETLVDFKEFIKIGVLELLHLEIYLDHQSFPGPLLKLARDIVKKTPGVDVTREALDRNEDKVMNRQQDLYRTLPPEVRVFPRRERGVLVYSASFNGRVSSLSSLLKTLREEIRDRDRLLGEEERKLFESFLTGETHQHLQSRLRSANFLVDTMNEQLKRRPTASGMELRLRWRLNEEAPPGTEEALKLLLKASHLLSNTDRSALQRFLQQRLDEARDEDGQGSLQDRMLSVLDYRFWHTFHVEFKTNTGPWKRLTRKAHAAGSGGQKAVMLHLPLFAAAAAFYESGYTVCPRLIILDEAFAGIDRDTRGHLMGLLQAFDLDFMMTSYEEWGFYEQIDGLATYHLARQRGMRGVYADRFLWDGHVVTEKGEE